jgi:hypothetical protein
MQTARQFVQAEAVAATSATTGKRFARATSTDHPNIIVIISDDHRQALQEDRKAPI